MGWFGRGKGESGKPARFGGGWGKDRKAAKDRVSRRAAEIERRRGTGGKGKQASALT